MSRASCAVRPSTSRWEKTMPTFISRACPTTCCTRAGVAGGFITVMVPDMLAPDDFARENAAAICKDLLEVRDLLVEGKLG